MKKTCSQTKLQLSEKGVVDTTNRNNHSSHSFVLVLLIAHLCKRFIEIWWQIYDRMTKTLLTTPYKLLASCVNSSPKSRPPFVLVRLYSEFTLRRDPRGFFRAVGPARFNVPIMMNEHAFYPNGKVGSECTYNRHKNIRLFKRHWK